MSETGRPTVLRTQPDMFDFGANYLGAQIAGSFQIINATACRGFTCWSEEGRVHHRETSSPDWLELSGPDPTRRQGLVWHFTVNTDRPGYRCASFMFDCDTGTAHARISVSLKEGTATLGDLVICDSPFHCTTDGASVTSLQRVLGGLDLRVHHVESLKQVMVLWKGTMLLHGSGLIRMAKRNMQEVVALAAAGTNIVVLADKFFQGTAEAANVVLASFGMSLAEGKEGPASSIEEIAARSVRVCEPLHVRAHPLTTGIRRAYWHRAWPVICNDGGIAVPLIINPSDPKNCFAAAAKPNGYVVCVGTSLYGSLSSVGWPYDNDRLLANLLAGGDAEAAGASPGVAANG